VSATLMVTVRDDDRRAPPALLTPVTVQYRQF